MANEIAYDPQAVVRPFAVASGQSVSAGQIVKYSSGILPCGDGEAPLGIAVTDGSAGEEVDVVIAGPCQALVAGATAEGILIASDADGRVVAAASTDAYLGKQITDGLASSGGVYALAWIHVNVSGAVAP